MAPRISRGTAQKLKRLLDMRYKVSEIAAELGVSTETVYRSYIPAGAPTVQDGNRLWIPGAAFAKWAMQFLASRRDGKEPKQMMGIGEGYCLRCNQVVKLVRPKVKAPNSRGVTLISGGCPNCGGRVNRFLGKDQQNDFA